MALTITNLSKEYANGVKALNDLSIKIEPGMFGLLGPNGAGKSTLMRTIATLQTADSGSITFNGIQVHESPMELRKVLGYLPQSFGVYKRESADNLLNYLAILKGLSDKTQRQELIDYALEVTNLTAVRKKHVSGYSGGMKQRFGIAQLLLNQPQLIIVDEPTAGLDPEERNRFLNILREIGTKNTVIFSTHIVEDIRDLCTDMAIMNKGKILLNTSPNKACQAIEGKVWKLNINSIELDSFSSKYQILSSSYEENNSLTIRIFSDTNPGQNFRVAKVNLEDVYFITLNDYVNNEIFQA